MAPFLYMTLSSAKLQISSKIFFSSRWRQEEEGCSSCFSFTVGSFWNSTLHKLWYFQTKSPPANIGRKSSFPNISAYRRMFSSNLFAAAAENNFCFLFLCFLFCLLQNIQTSCRTSGFACEDLTVRFAPTESNLTSTTRLSLNFWCHFFIFIRWYGEIPVNLL